MAISKRLRYEILRRDNHACRYCGEAAPHVKLTVDHVMPVALGGTDVPANLVAACVDCNTGKSSVPAGAPLVADVAQDALRWSRAMALATEKQIAQQWYRDGYVEKFDEIWTGWTYPVGEERHTLPRPGGWEASIWRFWEIGINLTELNECVTRAMAKTGVPKEQVWRYFMGVVWRRLDERMEIAKQILTEEEHRGA